MSGKAALVTGSSRGIGLAIAKRVAEAGGEVLLVSRRPEGLEEAARSLEGLPGEVSWFAAHVGHAAEAEAAVAACLDRYGRLDGLVNNAATNPYFGPMLGISESQMTKTYEVNQASVIHWSKAAWDAWMGEHGGSILSVSSVGGLHPEPGIGWYNVTKAAVVHVTRQLASELGPDVRVNALAPGLVRTELARALWETGEASFASQLPLGRIGEPEDVANAALFFLSDASSWVTGQVLAVDGGTSVMASGGISAL